MINRYRKTYLIIILLSFVIKASSQTGIVSGRELLEAEFAIWMAESPDTAVKRIRDKSMLLHYNGRFAEALAELERVDTSLITCEIKYLKSLNTFLEGSYHESYNRMLTIDYDTRISDTTYLKLWLFVLNENQFWTECRATMLQLQDTATGLYQEITFLPDSVIVLSPVKAQRLSSYLPGAGQMYAGSPFKGVTSFMLTGGFSAATVMFCLQGFYVSGLVYGLMPVIRFYSGGKHYSYKLACNKNEEAIQQLKEKYMNCIRQLDLKKN